MEFTLRNLPRHQVIWDITHQIPGIEASSIEAYLLFMLVASDVFTALQTELGRYGLSDGKLSILLKLSTSPGGALTPSQLAENLGITRASVTDLLSGLERAQLVVREPSQEDGRMALIRLSAQGQELLQRLIPDHFRRLQDLMQALSEQEKQELMVLLQKINQNIPLLRDA